MASSPSPTFLPALHRGSATRTRQRQSLPPLLPSRPVVLALLVLLRCAASSHAQVIPGFEGRGLSWEACYRQDHCQRPYYCLHYDEDSAQFRGCPLDPVTGGTDPLVTYIEDFDVQVVCHCLPLHGSEGTRCNATVPDCRPGEVCAQSGSGTVCVSCDALPTSPSSTTPSSSSSSSGQGDRPSPSPANPNNVALAFVPLDSSADVARTCSPLRGVNNNTASPTPSPSPLPPFLQTPTGWRDFRLGEYCLSNGCFRSSCAPPPGRHLYLADNETLSKLPSDEQRLVIEHNQFDSLGCDGSNSLCECQVDYLPLFNDSMWPCVTSDDCVDAAFRSEYKEGESSGGQFVCARDLRDGSQMCKSCRAVGMRAELLALPGDAKGQACERNWWKSTSTITNMPSSSSSSKKTNDDEIVINTPVVPTYKGWANGLSFESCLSHAMCQGERNCLRRTLRGKLEACNRPLCRCYPSLPSPSTTSSSTGSPVRDSGELTVCGLTIDGQPLAPSELKKSCPAGEACVVMPQQPPVCISALAVRLQSPAVLAVVGDEQDVGRAIDKLYTPPAASGRHLRMTGETCRHDWDCLDSGVGEGLGDGDGGYDNPRRCTHVSERGFDHGRCAGREGCVCERGVPVLCMGADDCVNNSTTTTASNNSNSTTDSSTPQVQELCIRARGAPRGMPGRCESPLLLDPDLYTIVDGTTAQQALVGSGLSLSLSSSPVGVLGQRLEQEPCTQHSDCARGHCAHVTDPRGSCSDYDGETTTREGCLCVNDPVCEIGFTPADAQVRKRPDGFALQGCMQGEACVAVRDQIVSMATYGIWARCMSRAVMDRRRPFLVEYLHALNGVAAGTSSATTTSTVTPTPSNTSPSGDDDGVCVDARLLTHLAQEDLVYTRGREPRAVTLCDARGSCATPGHMITWRGAAMTMRTWCLRHAPGGVGGDEGEGEEVRRRKEGGCVRRVMAVNSPRVGGGVVLLFSGRWSGEKKMGGMQRQRQRRVRTKTKDLEFTALAAKYGTAVEERLLRLLVRLGV